MPPTLRTGESVADLVYLGNIRDDPGLSRNIPGHGDESPKQAPLNQQRMLSDKTLGPPRATQDYSVEELRAMGMVGVYRAK